jgi:hypothetical protein
MSTVVALRAVDIICANLDRLQHPSGVVRLVQFAHDSPGLRKLRRQIAEALVMLLESSGFYLCNGLSEAEQLLTDNGYTVTAPQE